LHDIAGDHVTGGPEPRDGRYQASPPFQIEDNAMDKRKSEIVEPETFDPDAPSPIPADMPGEPLDVPSYPGDDDDSDDERDDENEAVPDDEDDDE
jgi:hypothetical protein